jgi:uncharacterized protein YaiE (UPF0345 family)
MANEVTITANIAVRKSNLVFDGKNASATFDMTGTGGPTPGYVTVGTTEESTAFPELSTLGFLFMKNLDTTNYIQWGFSTGVYGGRLKPGETALFRLEPGVTLYLKANTAACKALVYGFEN